MNHNSEELIQNLIRTNILESIKSNEDLLRLIENRLLKSAEDVAEVNERAYKILRHRFDDSFLMRIGPGDSPENFKCGKLHAVRDSPDPTKHIYVLIEYRFQKSILDILADVRLYILLENGIERGTFNHQYFDLKCHIAPCNFNATCNM